VGSRTEGASVLELVPPSVVGVFGVDVDAVVVGAVVVFSLTTSNVKVHFCVMLRVVCFF
jgi:hypothetical protein